jgi:hypothetical protein
MLKTYRLALSIVQVTSSCAEQQRRSCRVSLCLCMSPLLQLGSSPHVCQPSCLTKLPRL